MPLPLSMFNSRLGRSEWDLQSADILEEIPKRLLLFNNIRLITYWEQCDNNKQSKAMGEYGFNWGSRFSMN